MSKKKLSFFLTFFACQIIFGQEYNVYKSKVDTSFVSSYLGYEKKISILLPDDWQSNNQKKYPLIIVFDRQNQRSYNHIINTIDYLTAAEQMPRSIIISIESDNSKRISEAQNPISFKSGKAHLNEKYLFNEIVNLAESKFKASQFRVLIGHSWYGHFTTSMFTKNIDNLTAVIVLDPFFKQKNVSLIDSISALNNLEIKHTKYFRYSIGKDYPEDYRDIEFVKNENKNLKINIQGTYFPKAFHNAVPGLGIAEALYDIFEYWSIQQYNFFSPSNKSADIFTELKNNMINHYGNNLDFSLGVLNGKGWGFYDEEEFLKAITVWNELINQYPSFSEAYLYIIEAQQHLKLDTSKTKIKFKESVQLSQYYSQEEKKELLSELK
ncbi:alpha/beta hydrolase-fold protein [Lutibacter sp.]|uniref:alpha/beta hydrolase-fold protein n=1 Tax=Lutibacter sp. TaxID=1925666 RepID=UPI001A2DB1BA|nr:alpha/beta hydrolase-fold protein [Lutibacter sp.]MBI9042752.1 hypothetical protein [Lutibacter sp.]